jgi:hypothetical protein
MRTGRLATHNAEATGLYVIDEAVVNDRVLVAQPTAPATQQAAPLLMINGVPIGQPTP